MKCPNCGQEFEGGRCPNCGRPGASSGSRLAAVLVVVFLVLPAGVFGACSAALLAAGLRGGPDMLFLTLFLIFSVAGLGLAFAAMQWAKKLWKG